MPTPFTPAPIAAFISLISDDDDEPEETDEDWAGLYMRYPEAFANPARPIVKDNQNRKGRST